ncbi:CopG family transcriptional regulator [Trichocoleus sp. DQ-A3]|uniref:CopG family transcriptional regulator n=1 Tax=Cyanophyceae TaxID=3028117 RepID=UPI001683D8EA|nr:CopG family transcriptional regulator [Coleofasciculus sp. FACHB-125]MBD1903478.1 CopG family transcriptional regulator [Coleofasciculus sp. FACHB-125]
MTKKRKPLNDDDNLAKQFVYGEPITPLLKQNNPQEVEPPPKEATIRLTVDLAESMHRKLSILAARTGKKKAEIVRVLLDEALQDVED